MPAETHRVVVAGAGGNTGSHLLPHLARMPEIARITLVDPEFYEPANLAVQNIDRMDVDRPKVAVQAEKLRRIRPRIADSGLEIIGLQQRIEDVPRGLLMCDLIVSCLDSKAARQHVNEIAWRLGTPWIDCGVLGSQSLVRVNAYFPAQGSPCLECAWGHDEYSVLEQEYLCGAGSGATYPTMASSALGALAASLMAIEIGKLLRGAPAEQLGARQLILDAGHRAIQVTRGLRNPWCRFDHRSWVIEPWRCRPETTTVEAALSTLGSLRVEGHRFVCELACPGCGHREKLLRLNRPLARCAVCNRRMVSSGFGSLECIDSSLVGEYSTLTLAQVGLHAGDIVSSGNRHRHIHLPISEAA
jgi:molybdopterin/thiamine biosynthesis adenylyltransferase